MMPPRFAISLSPAPAGAAAAAAAEWFGRCPATDRPRPRRLVPGIAPALLESIIGATSRQGFHATLKGPFPLARATTRVRLQHFLGEFAAAREAFDTTAFEVRLHDGCLALVPDVPDARIEALAARCVVDFDRFRAPGATEEVATRLNGRQGAHLLKWGSIHVMEEFRLFYPLTGSLVPFEEAVVERIAEAAGEHFAPVARELRRVDALALFEAAEGSPAFRLVERAPLVAPLAIAAAG